MLRARLEEMFALFGTGGFVVLLVFVADALRAL